MTFVAQGEKITRDKAIEIENSGINIVDILLEDGSKVRVEVITLLMENL